MFVPMIKPDMSKQKPIDGEAANGSLQESWLFGSYFC